MKVRPEDGLSRLVVFGAAGAVLVGVIAAAFARQAESTLESKSGFFVAVAFVALGMAISSALLLRRTLVARRSFMKAALHLEYELPEMFARAGELAKTLPVTQISSVVRVLSELISYRLLTLTPAMHRVAVWLPDESGELLELAGAATRESRNPFRLGAKLSIEASIAGASYRLGKPLVWPGDFEEPSIRVGQSKRYSSFLCVPIVFGEHSVGVVTLDSRNRDAARKVDVEPLWRIVNSAAPAYAAILERLHHRLPAVAFA